MRFVSVFPYTLVSLNICFVNAALKNTIEYRLPKNAVGMCKRDPLWKNTFLHLGPGPARENIDRGPHKSKRQ